MRGVGSQEPARAVVSAAGQIPIQKRCGVRRSSKRMQVHVEKRRFLGNIDPAERRLEFQAVECNEAGAQPDEIAAMQVAMTFADTAACPPITHHQRE